jgi:pimeloyl-ACP methyl ester carboxylesterase
MTSVVTATFIQMLGEATAGENRADQQVKLRDGRMLGYAEYGAPDGKPVFCFHGFPGSRILWPAFDPHGSAATMNARVVAIDRPGVGLSDFKRGREILDWPNDVIELADVLKLDRFSVLGMSGGGPYAVACAFKISERLTSTGIVCGMGPIEAPGYMDGASWIFPGKSLLLRRLLLMLTSMVIRKNPDKFISQMNETVSAPDRALLKSHPEVANMIVDDWREAFRSGIGGTHQESTLYTRPWGFRLQDITAEVHLWHGEQDDNVVCSVGRYVADTIPNCHPTFFEDEGHFSVIYNHIEEILGVLAV